MESLLIPRRASGLSKIKIDKLTVRDITCNTLDVATINRKIYHITDDANTVSIDTVSDPQTTISTINIPAELIGTVCWVIAELQLGGNSSIRALNIAFENIASTKRVFNFPDSDVARTDYDVVATQTIANLTASTISLIGYGNYAVDKTVVWWKIIPMLTQEITELTLA